jgi:hypothetical protein
MVSEPHAETMDGERGAAGLNTIGGQLHDISTTRVDVAANLALVCVAFGV